MEKHNKGAHMPSHNITDQRIVVLTGGWSDEREIAFASAQHCVKALREAGFQTVEQLDIASPTFVSDLLAGNFDVAFIALHGEHGEDGCIQGLLEILHIPYTFSGVTASAVACDKALAKTVYKNYNIPTAADIIVQPGETISPQQVHDICSELGLPLFVKPTTNGSSYGITKVVQEDQLVEAIQLATQNGTPALLESCVVGTEVTVTVLGNSSARALPVIEIVSDGGFYDLKAKYEPAELHHIIPARLPPESYEQVQELAVRAHQALGCRGASRSDFIIQEDQTPVILETNTIPGMTETSLMPDAARHANISFPAFCRMLVELALEDTSAPKDA